MKFFHSARKTDTQVTADAEEHTPSAQVNAVTFELVTQHDSGVPQPNVEAEVSVPESKQCNGEVIALLNSLREQFDLRIRQDSLREQMFSVLHEQLKKQDENQQFLSRKGLYSSLFMLYDSISDLESQANGADELRNGIQNIRLELLDVLEREDVLLIEPLGEAFDRDRQTAVRVEPTSDRGQHQHVSRLIKAGFVYRERVLRPQTVVIKKYQTDEESVTSEQD